MNPNPKIRNAQPSDIDGVRLLLESCGLPFGGVEDQFADGFIVAEQDGQLVAVAGVEKYGDTGLLRSVAVREDFRGRRVGRLLVAECLTRARRRAISEIYLLTTDARKYFEALGFVPVDRKAVPSEVAVSPEFASICPETAITMLYRSSGPRFDNQRSGEIQ